MSELKLLPCPCCGSDDVSFGRVEDSRSWVICGTCGLNANSLDTLPEAGPVAVWNTRVTQPEATKPAQDLGAAILALPHDLYEEYPTMSAQAHEAAVKSYARKAAAALASPADALVEGDRVEGDLLPPIGSKVLIHLSRQDAWVEHTVTGYYVWGDLGGNKSLHRVFVRVVDADGFDNARLLEDVRAIQAQKDGHG